MLNTRGIHLGVVIVIVLLGAAVLVAPIYVSPTPNSSWHIVIPSNPSNPNEAISSLPDYQAGSYVASAFGISADHMLILSSSTGGDFNNFGQNVIFVGGWAYGPPANFAPWIISLSLLQEPTFQPQVTWTSSGQGFVLTTPKGSIPAVPGVGTITLGWDMRLQRYIVIAIGYNQADTLTVASMLPTQIMHLTSGHYVIIQNGAIIESG